jgi:hypothetical protein
MTSWRRVGTPSELAELWRGMGLAGSPPVVWRTSKLEAFVGREPIRPDDLRWHVSVRGPGRVPTWEELVSAAHSLRPGIVFCVPMPPRTWWLNVHENVLHLWEIRDANLEQQWQAEALGQEPS